MKIESAGWLDEAIRIESPHYNARPSVVNAIVLHNISLPPKTFDTTQYIHALFRGNFASFLQHHQSFASLAGLRVSSHFMIDRLGRIYQYVSTDKRAWHAGASVFKGVENCNDYSVGIELQGADDAPYTLKQYQKVSALCVALMRHYPDIELSRIIGHSDIAPERKTDPGQAFNWRFFNRSVAQWLAG